MASIASYAAKALRALTTAAANFSDVLALSAFTERAGATSAVLEACSFLLAGRAGEACGGKGAKEKAGKDEG